MRNELQEVLPSLGLISIRKNRNFLKPLQAPNIHDPKNRSQTTTRLCSLVRELQLTRHVSEASATQVMEVVVTTGRPVVLPVMGAPGQPFLTNWRSSVALFLHTGDVEGRPVPLFFTWRVFG